MPKYPQVRRLFADLLGDPAPTGTQVRTAEALGVRPATMSRWVNGEARPDPVYWPAIALHFDIDIEVVRDAAGRRMSIGFNGQIPDELSQLPAQLEAAVTRIEALERQVATLQTEALAAPEQSAGAVATDVDG